MVAAILRLLLKIVFQVFPNHLIQLGPGEAQAIPLLKRMGVGVPCHPGDGLLPRPCQVGGQQLVQLPLGFRLGDAQQPAQHHREEMCIRDSPNAIEDQLFFLEEPNNTVEGVGVRAARSEEEGVYIDPVSGESRSAQVTLYCTGCTLDGASVGLMAIADGTALTEEAAQRLAEVAAGYGVHYGLRPEGLSAEPKGKDTPNVNYGDSYHLTVLGPLRCV